MLERTLYLAPTAVRVEVTDGVVTLRGEVLRQSLLPIALRLCRSVDGVVAGHDQLCYTFDDRKIDLDPPKIHGTL
ncbi:osmotically-inducible protein OsmY [Streptacidiphilus sp. MAP12-16]|uniref:BON domain-containing protein n=1 Tax=Streptacidiphilus sp. MAP12-16 TaxID=3156300 RepID=UPI003514E571